MRGKMLALCVLDIRLDRFVTRELTNFTTSLCMYTRSPIITHSIM